MFRFIGNKIFLMKNAVHIENSKQFSNLPVGIIGAPFAKGQTKYGVQEGPSVLRDFGLVASLKEIGITVKDYGDVEFTDSEEEFGASKLKYPAAVSSACQQISYAVQSILKKKERFLVLGGDHSLAAGTIHGHSQVHENLCVLWIDAHADINTEATTKSGNVHGMPCSFIIKELQNCSSGCSNFSWLKPCIKKENIAFIGLRDVDPLERLILKNEGILNYSMRDIDKLGVIEVTSRALDAINPTGNSPLHISFDIDAIDKAVAPSTGTPVLGGLTLREGICIAEEVAKTNVLSGIDCVEINPKLGSKEQVQDTLAVATLIMKAFFGYSRSGNLPGNVSIPVGLL